MKCVVSICASLVIVAFIAPTHSFGAEKMFVRAVSAKLRSGKSPLTPVIETLKKGSEVEVLSRKGRFALVRTKDKKEGWIYFRRLSVEKSEGEAGIFSTLGSSFRGKDASQTATSAAPRGIDKELSTKTNSKPFGLGSGRSVWWDGP